MPKDSISFRLDREVRPVLGRAAKAAGMKVSNFVEEAVLEKLGDMEARRTSQEIVSLARQIERLREELALATEATLVIVGRREVYSAESAKAWVASHLRRREGTA